MPSPWDPGLQNERTRLAWQRTALSGLTCSLLIARLLALVSITLALFTALAALTCTAALGWLSIRRFRGANTALHADRPVGGGLPQLISTALLTLTAAGALVYVLVA